MESTDDIDDYLKEQRRGDGREGYGEHFSPIPGAIDGGAVIELPGYVPEACTDENKVDPAGKPDGQADNRGKGIAGIPGEVDLRSHQMVEKAVGGVQDHLECHRCCSRCNGDGHCIHSCREARAKILLLGKQAGRQADEKASQGNGYDKLEGYRHARPEGRVLEQGEVIVIGGKCNEYFCLAGFVGEEHAQEDGTEKWIVEEQTKDDQGRE